jgi:uncharacterized protein YndB with AHSA1/START domain
MDDQTQSARRPSGETKEEMTDITFTNNEPKPTIRLERSLPDPPSAVWRSLTDRDELKSWFPCDVLVEGDRWIPGAVITFVFPPDVMDLTMTGTVLTADEPHMLSYEWGEERLSFELHEEGTGTRLVLIDELDRDAAARNAAGWDICLARLTGVESVEGTWRDKFERYSATFEPTLGPQSGPPDAYKGNDVP